MNDAERAAGGYRRILPEELAMLQGIPNETVISDEIETLTN